MLLCEDAGCLAYFYCQRDVPGRQEPLSVLRSLVQQLYRLSTAQVVTSIAEGYQQRGGTGFTSDSLSLEVCEALLRDILSAPRNITILIDGLDECDPQCRRDLLEIFDDLLIDSSSMIRLFITSCDREDLAGFDGRINELSIGLDENEADIQALVRSRLEEDKRFSNEMSEDLAAEIAGVLSDKSQGM